MYSSEEQLIRIAVVASVGSLSLVAVIILGIMVFVGYKVAANVAVTEAKLAAQQEMRRYMATELHDNIGQLLVLATLQASALASRPDGVAAANLSRLHDLVARANAELRELAHVMDGRTTLDRGLADAIRQLATWLEQALGCEVSVAMEPAARPALSEAKVLVLFRAVQAALNNVAKHAQPTAVEIAVQATDGAFTIRISDDGAGFDPAGRHAGIGLYNIRKRLAQLQGSATIYSKPGRGTTVTLVVPLKQNQITHANRLYNPHQRGHPR